MIQPVIFYGVDCVASCYILICVQKPVPFIFSHLFFLLSFTLSLALSLSIVASHNKSINLLNKTKCKHSQTQRERQSHDHIPQYALSEIINLRPPVPNHLNTCILMELLLRNLYDHGKI